MSRNNVSEGTYPAPDEIDVERELYPYAIVWTPIPFLSWILPMIGHMGITDSQGNIYDFACSYYIYRNQMAFGNPTRYLKLHPKHLHHLEELAGGCRAPEVNDAGNDATMKNALLKACRHDTQAPSFLSSALYDAGIFATVKYFADTQVYSFCCNNCHSFVAYCLEKGEQLAVRYNANRANSGAADAGKELPTREAVIRSLIGDANSANGYKNHVVVPPTLQAKIGAWNMFVLGFYLFIFGRHVTIGRTIMTYLPFAIFVLIIVGLTMLLS